MKSPIQRILFLMAVVTPSSLFCQIGTPLGGDASSQRVALALQQIESIKTLVEHGVEAPIRLVQAEQDLADAQDRALLDRVQYADSADANEQQDGVMVAAAERRVNRERERIDQQEELIADGLPASRELTSSEEELKRRQVDLYWAQSRLQFRIQADELGEQRDRISNAQEVSRTEYPDFSVDGVEHYEGVGTFDEARDLKMAPHLDGRLIAAIRRLVYGTRGVELGRSPGGREENTGDASAFSDKLMIGIMWTKFNLQVCLQK